MLYQKDHSSLAYDSFLNCTAAIREFSLDEMVEQLVQDVKNIKGRLTEKDREAVVKAVSKTITLEERVKKWVLQALT